MQFFFFRTLNNNYLQYVPEAVTTAQRLPSIREINMDSNKLTFIETGAFTNLSTLENL